MSTFRYKLLNGGGVMKMKRWLGFWWKDYENYDNAIHTSEHKLHELWVKMQEEKAHHSRLITGRKAIVSSIGKAVGKLKGLGEPFGGKPFSGFRKPDVDAAPSDWKDAFKSSRGVNGHRPDASYTIESLGEFAGTTEWDLPPPRKNNGSNNQKQNNNNQRGSNN
jgi:hypothetical protein